jgi:hypothetical protein
MSLGLSKSKDGPDISPGKTKVCYTISMSKGVSDKITYKPYDQRQAYLIPPRVDELIKAVRENVMSRTKVRCGLPEGRNLISGRSMTFAGRC